MGTSTGPCLLWARGCVLSATHWRGPLEPSSPVRHDGTGTGECGTGFETQPARRKQGIQLVAVLSLLHEKQGPATEPSDRGGPPPESSRQAHGGRGTCRPSSHLED